MLQYLLPLFYIASCCVAADQPDTSVNSVQGIGPTLPKQSFLAADKSACENQNMSKIEQFLCMYGQGFNPAMQTIYITGSPWWRVEKLTSFLDKTGSGYLFTSGIGAHKYHDRRVSWNQARHICINEGGHLAIINSISEEKLLLRLLNESRNFEAWLGVHDLFEEGDWSTVLGEPMESTGYSKWTTQYKVIQPDNVNGKQHCGRLLKEGSIDDSECDNKLSFFCEINL